MTGPPEKARQQGAERATGTSPRLFSTRNLPAEIGVAALDAGAGLANLEVAFARCCSADASAGLRIWR